MLVIAKELVVLGISVLFCYINVNASQKKHSNYWSYLATLQIILHS
jgi:hypothetical protein